MAFRYPAHKRLLLESIRVEDGDPSLSATLTKALDHYLRHRGRLDAAA